jgi:hypothetical protein
MAGKKQLHEVAVLNTMRATTLTSWTPYVALYTVAPTDTTQGTEVTGGNYARQAVTFGTPPAGNPASMSNTVAVSWTNVTWSGTVVAWAICASSTLNADDAKYWLGGISKVVAATDTVQFAIGALTVTED